MKTNTTTKAKAKKIEFKKGQQVHFLINTAVGTTKGKGKITALPHPLRLTVTDNDGKQWKPYPSQCSAA